MIDVGVKCDLRARLRDPTTSHLSPSCQTPKRKEEVDVFLTKIVMSSASRVERVVQVEIFLE